MSKKRNPNSLNNLVNEVMKKSVEIPAKKRSIDPVNNGRWNQSEHILFIKGFL